MRSVILGTQHLEFRVQYLLFYNAQSYLPLLAFSEKPFIYDALVYTHVPRIIGAFYIINCC